MLLKLEEKCLEQLILLIPNQVPSVVISASTSVEIFVMDLTPLKLLNMKSKCGSQRDLTLTKVRLLNGSTNNLTCLLP